MPRRGQVTGDYWDEVRRIESAALDFEAADYCPPLRDMGMLQAAQNAMLQTARMPAVSPSQFPSVSPAQWFTAQEAAQFFAAPPNPQVVAEQMRQQYRHMTQDHADYQNMLALAQAGGASVGTIDKGLLAGVRDMIMGKKS